MARTDGTDGSGPALTAVSSFRLLCIHYSIVWRHWARSPPARRILVFTALALAFVLCYAAVAGVSDDYARLYADALSRYRQSLASPPPSQPYQPQTSNDVPASLAATPSPPQQQSPNANTDVTGSLPDVDVGTLALSLAFPHPPSSSSQDILADTEDDKNTPWYAHKQFGVVVDAGSSGSRIHIYAWDDPAYVAASRRAAATTDSKAKLIDSFPVVEKGVEDQAAGDDAWQLKTKPGISSFANHHEDLEQHIAPLVEFAMNKIPKEKQSSTPFYLMATAGLRLVDSKQRAKVLQRACEIVDSYRAFDLSGGCDVQFRVISGELEGIYGWIMVNYLKGGFDKRLAAITGQPLEEIANPSAKAAAKAAEELPSPGTDKTIKADAKTTAAKVSEEPKEKATEENKTSAPKKESEHVADVKAASIDSKPEPAKNNARSGVSLVSRNPRYSNMLAGRNPQKSNSNSVNDKENKIETYGFLDMGGASTQIAFEPSEKMAAQHKNDLTTMNLRTVLGRQVSFNVFVTTFLGFGMNEARRRYLSDLIIAAVKSPNGGIFPRAVIPEIPSVDKDNLKDDEFLRASIKKIPALIEDPCLPKGLKFSDESHLPTTISTMKPLPQFIGTGDLKQCIEMQNVLLMKELPCPDEPCLFNGVHAPISKFELHKFLGVSEYWYSSDEVYGLGGVYDYKQFMGASEELCGRNWDEIQSLYKSGGYPAVKDVSTISLQCFKAGWIINVLHDGLGMPRELPELPVNPVTNAPIDDTSAEELKVENALFESVNEIKDFGLTWTLGTMIMHIAATIPLSS